MTETITRLLDTEAAAEALGVPASAIHTWKHRHLVTPAGMVPGRGRGGLVPLWKLDDLRPLAEAYKPRSRHAETS